MLIAYRTVSYTSKSDREASDKQGNYKRVVPKRECTKHKRGYKAEMRLYKAQAWMVKQIRSPSMDEPLQSVNG